MPRRVVSECVVAPRCAPSVLLPDPGAFIPHRSEILPPYPGSPTYQGTVLAEAATYPWDRVADARLLGKYYLNVRWEGGMSVFERCKLADGHLQPSDPSNPNMHPPGYLN